MSPSKGTTRRTVRVPDELWDAAHAAARVRGEAVSDVIRRALEEYTMANPMLGKRGTRVYLVDGKYVAADEGGWTDENYSTEEEAWAAVDDEPA